MTDVQAAKLAGLAESLAGTFPGADHAPLARALLRLLARGEAVADHELAREVGWPRPDVTAVLEGWPNVHRDDRSAVVAFSGLSLTPTEHRFSVGGKELFTWCAWDTLFLPGLLDQPAVVTSACPMTGAPVRLKVAPARVSDADPADLWMSFPPVADTSTEDIVSSFCCHVHFIAGEAAADRWARENIGGRVLDLEDAFDVGIRATAALRT